MNEYFKLPLEYNEITTYFSKEHPAIDLGWKTNPNPNIYSIAEGKVIENGYNDSTGYRIWIQTDIDDIRYLHRYCHLKEQSNLKVGNTIKRGDLIGIMGSTGNSTGNHLHLDLWKCPKNYVMNWNDRLKYAVNPLLYCYLFEDQEQNPSSSNIQKVLATSLKTNRNEENNQIEVINKQLRIRKTPEINNNNILGYVDLGLYNILETKENDNYKWAKIGENKWIAETEDTKIYNKKINNNEIEKLQNENKKLKDEINNLNNKINDIENNLNKFTPKKDGYYYIYLNANENVYYKKKM